MLHTVEAVHHGEGEGDVEPGGVGGGQPLEVPPGHCEQGLHMALELWRDEGTAWRGCADG